MREMKLTGVIVGRRCMGKNLAFADIKREDDSSDIVQVVFRRTSSSWCRDRDTTFPIKTSSLPYGAKVVLDLRRREIHGGEMDTGPSLEVHSWEMIVNPWEEAQQAAKQQDGISCSEYLKARGTVFLNLQYPTRKIIKDKSLPFGGGCHGDRRHKALRAKVFASWLLDTFGATCLKQGGVLDIAGGKGQLSVELSIAAQIPCTIIDPLLRKRRPHKELKRLQKANGPSPGHMAKPFNCNEFLEGENELIVKRTSCLVGLHPDECTEDILDVALHFNKSVAIVPCCVFQSLFPMRQVRCGKMVRTYNDFLQFLLEKDSRLQQENLSFEGKNKVIYYKCDSD